jgi:maltose alpha-D-glucosyltransferase/alpha-amylase
MPKGPTASDPAWYKDAVIYELKVRTFCDSNGDGIGDFRGLTDKLGYLEDLGVTCLWLLPFYKSPWRDDGYDIAHYERIHPACGTMRDFTVFLDRAHARGMRVITELVLNHTSDRHPWFEAARRAPAGTSKRDFYVWSDRAERYAGARVIFSGAQESNWTWDPVAGAFYWHRFFHHQPDLNFDNPEVRLAILKVMRYWFDRGVDGLRLDAVAHLFEREGTTCENLPETHQFLKQIRRDVDERYPGRVLLAEANDQSHRVVEYFGENDECHMAFHFPLMPRLFLGMFREDAGPIIDIVHATRGIPDACQWATFLRNHDELTLSAVTDEERDFLVAACVAEPHMQLHRGIRRRLAPLLGNDQRRIELAHALLLSLPGTPVLYYGDEIGMGDDLRLPDRDGVRTPMQWSDDANAGFAAPGVNSLVIPLIDNPVNGYRVVNVASQERNRESLLSRIRRLIHVRRQHAAFGRGSIQFLPSGNPRVLAFVRQEEHDAVLVVANLSGSPQPVVLQLPSAVEQSALIEIVDDVVFPWHGSSSYVLTLGGYASYWLQAAPRQHGAGVVDGSAQKVIRNPSCSVRGA